MYPEQWVWLWVVPAVVVFWVWAFRHRRRALGQFSQSALLPAIAGLVHWDMRKAKAVLVTTALFLLLVALMGPHWGFRWREVVSKGSSIIFLVDVSNSMLAEDVRPSRLARAKLVIKELLFPLRGERVALVAFAGSSYVQCPLTTDYGAFLLALDDLSPDTMPRGGTQLSRALRYSLTVFGEAATGARALVLFSDGESHERLSEVLEAAEAVANGGVKIFAIGMGTPAGDLIPVVDAQGARMYLKDGAGRTVRSRLAEQVLAQVATSTGGSYARNGTTARWLDQISQGHLASLQREKLESPLEKEPVKRFQWILALALLLLTVEPFLSDRRRIA